MKHRSRHLILGFIIACCSLSQDLLSEDTLNYAFPQVIVQSSRLSLSVFDMNQSVSIIQPEVLRYASPNSPEDAIRMFTTTELRRRGAFGVQTDIGIRGSTFSQQLILFNGIRINDPQTAHHNFDIPISLNSIKQIEIVRGPNSMQYGPDAYGGIINIVSNPDSPLLSAEFAGGQYGFTQGIVAYGLHEENFNSLNTVDYRRSDGFRYDTEFENLQLSTQNSADVSWGKINFFGGYIKKDFGAYDFYSPGLNVPSHEKTETFLNSLQTDFSALEWNIVARISYRHHYDHFVYNIQKPALSNNQHNTNLYTIEILGSRVLNELFTLSNSIEVSLDNINSSKLGVHERNFAAFSSIARLILTDQLSIDGGMRLDAHSEFGTTLHPTFNVGYVIAEMTKLYASAGTSFRAPSYTDLYYSDPANIGNANLKPERGISGEVGVHSQITVNTSLQASGFYRQQNNLIDYVQHFSGDKYHAENFSEATVRGVELQSQWMNFGVNDNILKQAFFGYTYIESQLDIKSAFRTKYSFTHPKHQLNGAFTIQLPFEILSTVSGSYSYRSKLPSTSLFDLTILKSIGTVDVIFSVSNLFNKSYEEIPGIHLPGRWMIGKVRWSIQ